MRLLKRRYGGDPSTWKKKNAIALAGRAARRDGVARGRAGARGGGDKRRRVDGAVSNLSTLCLQPCVDERHTRSGSVISVWVKWAGLRWVRFGARYDA